MRFTVLAVGMLPGPGMAAVQGDSALQAATQAATQVAMNAPECQAARPFYWEIGNAQGLQAAGQVGLSAPDANAVMPIASASKWLYGAYVAEVRQGGLTTEDVRSLTMRAGYDQLSYPSCLRLVPVLKQRETVAECLATGKNGSQDAQAVNRFFYNGGHFQQHAVAQMGLGDLNNEGLALVINQTLHLSPEVTYDSPQLAAGVSASASAYAAFLRQLLRGDRVLSSLLGQASVCTNPAHCQDAISTPIPDTEQWRYSLGHWVESDPVVGDGSFSSPGAFGFYPWINAARDTYGVLARHHLGEKAYYNSVQCGRAIRKAWFDAGQ